jgi:patatin-like phospholipase/acyl hydrolase
MSIYRILSLDGGGIRGIITAILLERLEEAHPGFVQSFDLFAGTSTGGILALAFAAGFTPQQARQLYETYGESVFTDSLIDNIKDLGNFIGAQYSIAPLRAELSRAFGPRTLAELPKKVLISAFDLDNAPQAGQATRSWKPKFFHNFPGPDSDGEQLAVDVAVRTSAAPTYFPVYQGFIDGGVVAGNPAMCALAQALHPTTGGQKLEQVVLLSLGTGRNPHFLATENGDWGLLQWAPHLVGLMLEGNIGTTEYQCRQLLGERWLRLNPVLPEPIDMDQVKKLSRMKEIAQQFDLSEAHLWISQFFSAAARP